MTPEGPRDPRLADPEVQALLEVYKDARARIEELGKVGTDSPRVEIMMDRADTAFEDGDILSAERYIERALGMAERSTSIFLDRFIRETQRAMRALEDMGYGVSDSLVLLKSAERNRESKDFKRSSKRAFRSIEEVHGAPPMLKTTLMDLMKAKYNMTLTEVLGCELHTARDEWERGLIALLKKDYPKANEHQWNVRMEVREAAGRYRTVQEKRERALEAIRMGTRMGADMDKAQDHLSKAIPFIEDNDLDQAESLLDMAIHDAIEGGKEIQWDGEDELPHQSS